MQVNSRLLTQLAAIALIFALATGCSFKRKRYENPITKDTLQPDKVLFDRAIKDVEKGRYEVARLTLNTLINTYDTSEYLAKAKLAIADSWYREGGAHGLAQAEAEYKDFILFYPQMEEAAESQWKVCQIHYKQMEKADRDSSQAQRTEDECKAMLTQFPNSKYLPQAQQMLRNAQEVLAQKEFLAGSFYHSKGSYPAAANRLSFVADQYPLFSGADEALWGAADSFRRMGDRFENQTADLYSKIVKDYPLSPRAPDAKDKLEAMKRPVPPADPAAVERMKYEAENRTKPGMMHSAWGLVSGKPDTHLAAKSGTPTMQALRPPTPVSVPPTPGTATGNSNVTAGGGGVSSDVSASVNTGPSNIDTKPDARQSAGGGAGTPAAGSNAAAAAGTPAAGTAGAATQDQAAAQPLPSNHANALGKPKKKSKKQIQKEQELLKKQQQDQAAKPQQ
jgi:outer membrane protein assembly factor BamD